MRLGQLPLDKLRDIAGHLTDFTPAFPSIINPIQQRVNVYKEIFAFHSRAAATFANEKFCDTFNSTAIIQKSGLVEWACPPEPVSLPDWFSKVVWCSSRDPTSCVEAPAYGDLANEANFAFKYSAHWARKTVPTVLTASPTTKTINDPALSAYKEPTFIIPLLYLAMGIILVTFTFGIIARFSRPRVQYVRGSGHGIGFSKPPLPGSSSLLFGEIGNALPTQAQIDAEMRAKFALYMATFTSLTGVSNEIVALMGLLYWQQFLSRPIPPPPAAFPEGDTQEDMAHDESHKDLNVQASRRQGEWAYLIRRIAILTASHFFHVASSPHPVDENSDHAEAAHISPDGNGMPFLRSLLTPV